MSENPNVQFNPNSYNYQNGRNQQPYNPQPDDSKRILCGVMAIIFGGLGIHYFIMGKTVAGLLSILLSLCTCGIWSMVMLAQGIVILCMSDQEFNRKYIYSTSTLPLF